MRQARGVLVLRGTAVRGALAVLLFAVCGHALALDPTMQPSQYVLDNWQIRRGCRSPPRKP